MRFAPDEAATRNDDSLPEDPGAGSDDAPGTRALTLRDVLLAALGQTTPAIDPLEWPPDLFALTSHILRRTGVYRYLVEPAYGNWPPQDGWNWKVNDAAAKWTKWILKDPQQDALPGLLDEHWSRLNACAADILVTTLQHRHRIDKKHWNVCQSILTLHSIADQACAGFGLPSGGGAARASHGIRLLANLHLATSGSLSRLPKHFGVVLPKMRTPQSGLTLRSMSHHLTFHETEVNAVWRTMPWVNTNEETVNILVIPWPNRMEASWFAPSASTTIRRRYQNDRIFSYTPTARLNSHAVIDLLREARRKVGIVHLIVFPELALTFEELRRIKDLLQKDEEILSTEMPMLVSGVRGRGSEDDPRQRANRVVLSMFFAEKWYDLHQHKHHRWKLTPSQVQQYSLSGVLSSSHAWWEDIPVYRRHLSFLAPNGWFIFAPLICEDLAQMDPVADILRGVGPTLLTAVLLDGPQLAERWSGRYASVLADDPGSSILTLTCTGMTARSRPRPHEAAKGANTICLWKDQEYGWQQVGIAEGHQGCVLTVGAKWCEEFTTDGRSDGGNSASLSLRQHVCVTTGLPLELQEGEDSVESEAYDHVLRRADKQDLKELTRMTYLVDAMLDSDANDRVEMARWVSVGAAGSEAPNQARPSASLWRLIQARLRDDEARRREEDRRDGPRRIGSLDRRLEQDLRYASERLPELLRHVDRKVGKDGRTGLPWWTAVVDECQQHLGRVTREGVITPMANYRLRAAEVGRIEIFMAKALLWAVHNRLTRQRRRGDLPPGGEELLSRVEELQSRRYRSWLRKVAGKSAS